MQKHFFFDLDNTLTPSKSLIEPEHLPVFKALSEQADVIVVSGHGENDIRKHLRPELDRSYHVLGQNGNRAVTKSGEILWNRSLSDQQKMAIRAFIAHAREELKRSGIVTTVKDESDIVEDRDSQIAFSLIGHHENKAIKDAFDSDFEKRRSVLEAAEANGEMKKLTEASVEARIGGTTNIDFFQLGKNKGYNVAAFIEKMGWKKDDCIYLGDALFPGGNDETVVGVIPTHAVRDYRETYEFLKKMLQS